MTTTIKQEFARFQFIITELDLALTSLSAEDTAKAERNAENAKLAYRTAARFRDKAPLSLDMNREIDVRVEKLAPLIARLP